jgi:hypothetical protein
MDALSCQGMSENKYGNRAITTYTSFQEKTMANVTRRTFGKYISSAALALGIGEVTMGFGCGVFTDILTYVPIGLEAFETIISLLDPSLATALAPIIVKVKAALADIAAAVQAYQNAPASEKATLLGKITTAINVAIDEIQAFWSSLNLPDQNLATTIADVLQIILSTLAGFLPLLGGSLLMGKHHPKSLPVTPALRSQKKFKKEINEVLRKHGYAGRIY